MLKFIAYFLFEFNLINYFQKFCLKFNNSIDSLWTFQLKELLFLRYKELNNEFTKLIINKLNERKEFGYLWLSVRGGSTEDFLKSCDNEYIIFAMLDSIAEWYNDYSNKVFCSYPMKFLSINDNEHLKLHKYSMSKFYAINKICEIYNIEIDIKELNFIYHKKFITLIDVIRHRTVICDKLLSHNDLNPHIKNWIIFNIEIFS